MIGFTAYETHTALNLHFNKSASYDFFLYNGKTKMTRETFTRSNFQWQYAALERKIDNLLLFFYEAYKANGFKYVRPGELFRRTKMAQPRIEDYNDNIVRDLQRMRELYVDNPLDLVEVGTLYPNVYEAHVYGKISLETALLVDLHVKTVFNTDLSKDIVSWPIIVNDMEKVRPFIDRLFDSEQFIENFSNHYLLNTEARGTSGAERSSVATKTNTGNQK